MMGMLSLDVIYQDFYIDVNYSKLNLNIHKHELQLWHIQTV
jgi:hypothetical protein